MAQQSPVIFTDAVTSATLTNGVVRITFGALGAENKMEPAGTLLIPLNQLAGIVQNLANATNGLIAKAREAQTKAGTPPEDETVPDDINLV